MLGKAASIDRAVRNGENAWNDDTARSAASVAQAMGGVLKLAATTWWKTRLSYYEIITQSVESSCIRGTWNGRLSTRMSSSRR